MNFVGRKQELKQLEQFVFKSSTPILVIYGPRGIGKSALIYKFIETYNKKLADNYFIINGMQADNDFSRFLDNTKEIGFIEDYFGGNERSFQHIKNLVDTKLIKKVVITTSYAPLLASSNLAGRVTYLEIRGLSTFELNEIVKERITNSGSRFIDEKSLLDVYEYLHNNPRLILIALDFLLSHQSFPTNQLISFLETPLEVPGLVDIYGNPLSRNSEKIKAVENKIVIVNSSLVDQIYHDPEAIYKLSPSMFEELVAELLEREGYSVEVTKKTRDGGKDILVAHHSIIGNFLFYVECKRYAPNNHVGIQLVKNLYATVSADRATAGLLVTTSYFTKPAHSFVEHLQHQINLTDYLELKEWINKSYTKRYGA